MGYPGAIPSALFDPLRYLEKQAHARVSVASDGKVMLTFDGPVAPHERERAWAIARRYEQLISLQVDHGRASVQKLIAQGFLVLRAGRYCLPQLCSRP